MEILILSILGSRNDGAEVEVEVEVEGESNFRGMLHRLGLGTIREEEGIGILGVEGETLSTMWIGKGRVQVNL